MRRFPRPRPPRRSAATLVERRLAACVNILPGMTSIYRWEGKIARDSEAVMIIKTRQSLAEAVIAEVKQRHPYTNPALRRAADRRRLGRLPALARRGDGASGQMSGK